MPAIAPGLPEATVRGPYPAETPAGTAWRARLNSLWALEPLWVSGLGLLLILAGDRWLPLRGETYEWTQYKIFGTVFPALTLALVYLGHVRATAVKTAARWFRLALALCFLALSLHYCLDRHHFNRYVILLSLTGVFLLCQGRWRRPQVRPGLLELLGYTLVMVAAWTAALKISWWNPVEDWTKLRRLPAFLVLYFVVANVGGRSRFLGWRTTKHNLGAPAALSLRLSDLGLLDAMSILVLGLASLRHDFQFTTSVMHHWGFYVGPAQLARQGGWLLWDVPSQYGLLNILLLSRMPFHSLWQALYVLDSLLLFIAAGLCYGVLRLLRPGWLNASFALIVTLCVVFLIPGDLGALNGPSPFPSTGPMRFFWCYPLLAILAWQFHHHARRTASFARHGSATHGARDSSGWLLVLGCCAWLCGTLWSVESAVYCAFIWLPAYLLLACHHVGGATTSAPARRNCRWCGWHLLGWLALPLSMAISVWVGVALWFYWRLGHPPDWTCFYEYSLSYATNFGTVAIEPQGVVWALILIGCAIMTAIAHLPLTRQNLPAWSLALGAWGAAWATSSYYIGRSVASNVSNNAPILALSMACIFLLLAQAKADIRDSPTGADTEDGAVPGQDVQSPPHLEETPWRVFVRCGLVPVYAVFLLIPMTVVSPRGHQVSHLLSSLRQGYDPHLERKLPLMEPSLHALFLQANVQPTDAVCIVGQVPLDAWSPPNVPNPELVTMSPEWVPAEPLVLLTPLSRTRRRVYMERFTAQTHRSGWLVRPKVMWDSFVWPNATGWFSDMDWFYRQIHRTHTPTKRFENSKWTLIWFQYDPIHLAPHRGTRLSSTAPGPALRASPRFNLRDAPAR